MWSELVKVEAVGVEGDPLCINGGGVLDKPHTIKRLVVAVAVADVDIGHALLPAQFGVTVRLVPLQLGCLSLGSLGCLVTGFLCRGTSIPVKCLLWAPPLPQSHHLHHIRCVCLGVSPSFACCTTSTLCGTNSS